jgi:acetylglutamate kinase
VGLTVVKCGGALLAKERFAIARHVDEGADACVVHGAGSRISRALDEAGVVSSFVGGRRVTTDEAIPIVREAFKRENQELCRQIGDRAVGLMGDDLGLEAERIPGYGHAGMLLPVVPAALWGLLAVGALPVIAPLARGPLNVNADEAASALAVGIGADQIVFLTDVPGVFHEGRLLHSIRAGRAETLVDSGHFDGGIVPKLLAASHAARNGLVAEIGATAVLA